MATKTTTAPTALAASALALITIDPAALRVRDNARQDATPDDELVASIRAHGIIQPPIVEEHDDGDGYVIVTGHRRVGAAIAAGLAEITCVLRTTPLGSASTTLEQQIVENERRKQLTAKDLVAGYQRLTLFGLRPEDIAAGLGEKPARVRAGLKITESEKATQLIDDEPSIDFEQAATVAEYDDYPKLQSKLIETATTRPENFHRDAESARTDRQVEDRINTITATLAAEGVTVVDVVSYEDSWWSGRGVGTGKGRTLDWLGIDPAEHTSCPGHAVVIHRAQAYYLENEGGFAILPVCTDWRANGHAADAQTTAEPTPEELAAAAERQQRLAQHQEHQQLVEANTRTRRAWIHGHLNAGRLRPVAQHFELIADATALLIADQNGIPAHIMLELLTDQQYPQYSDKTDDTLISLIRAREAAPARAAVALAFAVFEDAIYGPPAVTYFPALEALGYTLTETDREHLTTAQTELDTLALADDGGDDAGDELEGDEAEEDTQP